MKYLCWKTPEKIQLQAIRDPENTAPELAYQYISSTKTYRFYGRYTPHDHYMGHPFGETLRTLLFLLRNKNIAHQLIEGKLDKIGAYYIPLGIYIELEKSDFQQLKQQSIL